MRYKGGQPQKLDIVNKGFKNCMHFAPIYVMEFDVYNTHVHLTPMHLLLKLGAVSLTL